MDTDPAKGAASTAYCGSYGVARLREGSRKNGIEGFTRARFRKNKKIVLEKSAPFAGFRLVIADHALGLPVLRYAFLVYMLSPLPGRSGWAYSSLCFTQPYQPSPKGLSGRPAHCPFRGLLSVSLAFGLHTRAVANS